MAKRLVIIESPHASDPEANSVYTRACLRHALLVGDAPIASHALYTLPGVLDDTVDVERGLGIAAGLAWLRVADASVVYVDRGISDGMLAGIHEAVEHGVPVEYRELGGLWRKG